MLRVAVLTSGRAPGLAYLLDEDPLRGALYEIVGVASSDAECVERGPCVAHRVPFATLDLRAFARARGERWTDMQCRELYDATLIDLIAPWRADAVACAGYLHVLTPHFLGAFPGRVLNVHDADLAIVREGRPKYRGLRSTRDAIIAGEVETRCTVHVVTPELDEGPVIARSRAFPVHTLVADARRWQAIDMLKAYAYAQREWMMRAAFGPLLSRGIAWLASGGVAGTLPADDRQHRVPPGRPPRTGTEGRRARVRRALSRGRTLG